MAELFGRRDELDAVLHQLEGEGPSLIVRGPTGIGKTAFLRALNTHLTNKGPKELRPVLYEAESAAHPLSHYISVVTRGIIDDAHLRTFSLNDFRAALNASSSDYTARLTTAALLDFVKAGAPFLEETADSLFTIIREVTAESQVKALAQRLITSAQREIIPGFFTLIRMFGQLGLPRCLLLDRLEAGSDAVLEFVAAVNANLPASWRLVAGINDEKPAGITALKTLQASARSTALTEVALSPLGLKDFERWTLSVRGYVPPANILEEVRRRSQGRPLFLREWISSMKDDLPPENLVNHCTDYYSSRLHQLPSDASRDVVCSLSLIPSYSYFSFEFIQKMSGIEDPRETWKVIEGLESAFFLEGHPDNLEEYRFVHELTAQSIASSLPDRVRTNYAQQICDIVRDGPKSTLGNEYDWLVLRDLGKRYAWISQDDVAPVAVLVNNGAYEDALAALAILRRAGELTDNSSLTADSILGLAEAHYKTGRYDEAFDVLKIFEDNGGEEFRRRAADLSLIRGKLFMRRNNYPEAREHLREAAIQFAATGRVQREIEARRQQNVVLRDLEQYDQAVDDARELLADVSRYRQEDGDGKINPLMTCACYRALARSLTLQATQLEEAREAATTALKIATDQNSARAIANSELALAESWRHALLYEDAVEAYRRALVGAREVANRDCELWAALGLSDALFLQGNVASAAEALQSISLVMQDDRKHPLEHANWSFSRQVLRFAQGQIGHEELALLPELYGRLALRWPGEYVAAAANLGTFPPWPKPF